MSGPRNKDKSAKRQIVIKRIRRTEHARPAGAWKIAYADFVTAMMAFFLLMWLTSAMPREDLHAISEYFKTPLMVVLRGGQSNDVRNDVIIGSYGDDKTKESMQVRKEPPLSQQIAIMANDAQQLLHLQEISRLQLLKRQLEALIEADAKLRKFKNSC
jgi:chemotaxis protein MotB